MSTSRLEFFDSLATRASARVLAAYSSSFSLSTRLLGHRERADIRALYAMVRVADEIVDGVGAEAGIDVAACLDSYEQAALAAMRSRFSPDPVLHAFGLTARRCGFEEEWVRAFFSSMRADIAPRSMKPHLMSKAEFERYVYGSAEVIGLMCVAVFIRGVEVLPSDYQIMQHSARRLGAAFQKVNFLRDLGDDTARLGRRYYPVPLSEGDKAEIVRDIRADLDAAEPGLALLPGGARRAVRLARDVYAELLVALERTPAAEITRRRVRVPARRKWWLAGRGMTSPVTQWRG
ncbi:MULTISPECIES: phytoene/squalene synthase family protein [unclassified Corynebacterium]|uniref:phytoene/squalene synthase family protein n=1 Tax=unclassified Corynebacterium TaxID=2624378 RepID=UPI0029CA87BC|nr:MULTISPECIES: phytoene/squalene synthase family protein [unclassified Corynebacterium]WPF65632.1 phytoene/squalene synthase family protein [Corynebacterium sp. 22KM0430]WPF68127.1 phytoene/squalene synthase family protein [Corynebacterium sp. 21KM1197]